MRKNRLTLLMVSVLVFAFVLTACGGGTATTTTTGKPSAGTTTAATSGVASGKTFRLGVYQRLTGATGYAGLAAKDSIEMAIDYINKNGGVNGAKIEMIIYDTQGLPEEAVKVVNKMIASDNIDACIGSDNSAEVLAAATYLNDKGIYNFGLGTSPTWMAKDWPFVFRAAANTNIGTPLTAQLVKDVGYKSVAIFMGMDDSARTTGLAFKAACEKIGVSVLAEEQYDAADLDFSAQIIKLTKSGADTIYMALSGAANPNFVKQLRQSGYTGMIFSKESFTTRNIAVTGEKAAEYVAFSDPYVVYNDIKDIDIPVMKQFAQMYLDRYKKLPDDSCAYRAWDSMMVFWAASKIAGKNDSVSLRDATKKVSLDGLGGKLDYSSGNREGYSQFNSFIVIKGKNQLWKSWIDGGGYKAYLAATGNKK